MEDLREILTKMCGNETYQRVGTPHPLAIYVGIDNENRYSLFCITNTKPKSISSTKLIHVFIGRRQDNDYGITFSLVDIKFLDVFVHFCDDIIETSKKESDVSKGADIICARYIQWQKTFTKVSEGLLSQAEVKGLIGEMCFLKMKMIPQFGEEKALDSWSGIEMTDQDFLCDDTWYEVKSTVSGSPSVKISSVEQLDTQKDGHLIVVTLDKTSNGDSSRITLNNMYHMVIESFSSKVLQENFKARMLRYGYIEQEGYDQWGYKYNGMSSYLVNKDFPCVRKNNVPVSAENITYDLSLAAIEGYKE